jgi:malonate transporter
MPLIPNLLLVLSALWPIFLVIMLGYALSRSQFPGAAFWPAAERLTYFLLFPALLVDKLALADLKAYALAPFAGVISVALTVMTLLLYGLRPFLKMTGPAFSSVYQGSIRFNTYVGLAAAGALYHVPGTTLAVLAITILIPLVNVLCVGVLTHTTAAMDRAGLIARMTRNPLILACLFGIALNLSGLGLPLGSESIVEILARAALPLGLLAVGAGLRARSALARQREVAVSTVLKLLALPALTGLLSHLAGLGEVETAVLVLFAALPGAPSSYILARQLGGDAELMAAIVTVETAASLLSLPLILLWFA